MAAITGRSISQAQKARITDLVKERKQAALSDTEKSAEQQEPHKITVLPNRNIGTAARKIQGKLLTLHTGAVVKLSFLFILLTDTSTFRDYLIQGIQ